MLRSMACGSVNTRRVSAPKDYMDRCCRLTRVSYRRAPGGRTIALLTVATLFASACVVPAAAAQEITDSCANSAAQSRPVDDGRPILFDEFVQPFVEAAAARRAALRLTDTAFDHRVDE